MQKKNCDLERREQSRKSGSGTATGQCVGRNTREPGNRLRFSTEDQGKTARYKGAVLKVILSMPQACLTPLLGIACELEQIYQMCVLSIL